MKSRNSWLTSSNVETIPPGLRPNNRKGNTMLNRLTLVLLVLLLTLPISSMGQNHKILLFVPEENPEYLVTDIMLKKEAGAMISILEDAGYMVDIATVSGNLVVAGKTSFRPDYNISEINVNNYVGLILPSIRTCHREPISAEAAKVIRQFAEQNKPIAAQAYGIEWLGEAGILSGRKFSFVSSSVNSIRLKNKLKGGILVDKRPIVKDGNIITSGVCPDISRRFNLPDGTTQLMRKLIKEIETS